MSLPNEIIGAMIDGGFRRMIEQMQAENAHVPAGKWIVNIFGEANKRSFEISVIREDFAHGRRSYGWFGKDKLLITHNGGPCDWPIVQPAWDALVRAAHEVADKLNADEGRA